MSGMAASASDPRERLHRRPTMEDPRPVHRTRRTWSNNGVQYAMETTSFSGPGISFGSLSGSANGSIRRTFTTPQGQAQPSFGALFGGSGLGNLVDDFFSLPQASQSRVPVEDGRRRPNLRTVDTHHTSDDEDEDDDALAYTDYSEDDGHSRHRPSIVSRLKDKLADHARQRREHRRSREQSPTRRRSKTVQRSNSYHVEEREPAWAQQRERRGSFSDSETDDSDSENFVETTRQRYQSTGANDSAAVIRALEVAAAAEQRAVSTARSRLQTASQQPHASTAYLQDLLNDMQKHETSLRNINAQLSQAKGRQQRARAQQVPNPHRRSKPMPRSRRPSSPARTPDSFATHTPNWMHIFPESQQPETLFRRFEEMFVPLAGTGHPVFRQFMAATTDPDSSIPQTHTFTNVPGPTSNASNANAQPQRTRFTSAGGPQYVRTPTSQFVPQPRAPPANVLLPAEAQRLFTEYNARWTALAPHDPNVPYPARGLSSTSLIARDSIHAPTTRTAVRNWSDEVVMQANVQAFYLGVVGLRPSYTESAVSGKVETGFEKRTASDAQVKQLVEILKKEKARWHSDRLGRRNGGGGGVNVVLQADERARAVFHGVCELMVCAQGGT